MIFDNLSTRILLAVIDGNTSSTTIAQTVDADRFTVYRRLCQLRAEGLIEWESGLAETIRATVREVEIRR